ncbi:MAG: sugar phosphate isomerase/epimerase family protein [Candidatus Latescibacterota bacterium]|jgi:sugar phosphate isomerase/epimerase
MKLGIFSKTFIRPTLEETIAAVAAHGLESIQFNWETAGLDDMPTEVPAALCGRIRHSLQKHEIELAAISGTFNIIHPTYRQEGMRRLSALAKACSSLGTQFITLCTGTRDDDYLWRYHADNSSPAAWSDMLNAMREAVEIASDHLKVVIDGANLFHQGELPRMHEILDEAFQLLGDDILLAHGKDLERDGDAGTGVLDYAHYLHCLEQIGFKGTIALHSLSEEQTPTAITHMQKNWPH